MTFLIISSGLSTTINSSSGNKDNISHSPHVTRTKSLYKYSDILFKYLNHLLR